MLQAAAYRLTSIAYTWNSGRTSLIRAHIASNLPLDGMCQSSICAFRALPVCGRINFRDNIKGILLQLEEGPFIKNPGAFSRLPPPLLQMAFRLIALNITYVLSVNWQRVHLRKEGASVGPRIRNARFWGMCSFYEGIDPRVPA